MNRGEFLRGLQEALSGEVPPAVVQENLRYYDNYIRTEEQKGRDESAVLEELGSPRLIARTIIEATPGAGDGNHEPYRSYDYYQSQESQRQSRDGYENPQREPNIHYYNLNKWYWKLLGIILLVAVFVLVITVVTGLLSLVIPLLPVIGMVLLIMWVVRSFDSRW